MVRLDWGFLGLSVSLWVKTWGTDKVYWWWRDIGPGIASAMILGRHRRSSIRIIMTAIQTYVIKCWVAALSLGWTLTLVPLVLLLTLVPLVLLLLWSIRVASSVIPAVWVPWSSILISISRVVILFGLYESLRAVSNSVIFLLWQKM